MDTKQAWGKLDGRKGYHIIISWKPGECTEEKAYQIIQEFCQDDLIGFFPPYILPVSN